MSLAESEPSESAAPPPPSSSPKRKDSGSTSITNGAIDVLQPSSQEEEEKKKERQQLQQQQQQQGQQVVAPRDLRLNEDPQKKLMLKEKEIEKMETEYELETRDYDWRQNGNEVSIFIMLRDSNINAMDIEVIQRSSKKLDVRRYIHIVMEKKERDRVWPYCFTSEDREATMEITNRVYMDIDIDDERIGRIVIGLFGHDAPATCKNFRYFCNNQPQDTYKGKEMTYKGTRVHRVIPNFIIQGDGSGSGSIYGSTFKDENFRIRCADMVCLCWTVFISHNEAGILTMANTGRDTNAAQFMITLQPSSWLDLKHVAFGKVVDGLDILEKIAEKGSLNGEPTANIVISGCGELPWY
eukprot:jgi/Bigna1/75487/fgenesh1_pg.35_\